MFPNRFCKAKNVIVFLYIFFSLEFKYDFTSWHFDDGPVVKIICPEIDQSIADT
jgi:hypothetical protein